jgi:hypothetical protein
MPKLRSKKKRNLTADESRTTSNSVTPAMVKSLTLRRNVVGRIHSPRKLPEISELADRSAME